MPIHTYSDVCIKKEVISYRCFCNDNYSINGHTITDSFNQLSYNCGLSINYLSYNMSFSVNYRMFAIILSIYVRLWSLNKLLYVYDSIRSIIVRLQLLNDYSICYHMIIAV